MEGKNSPWQLSWINLENFPHSSSKKLANKDFIVSRLQTNPVSHHLTLLQTSYSICQFLYRTFASELSATSDKIQSFLLMLDKKMVAFPIYLE